MHACISNACNSRMHFVTCQFNRLSLEKIPSTQFEKKKKKKKKRRRRKKERRKVVQLRIALVLN
jgi:hypothetical protein